MMYNRWRSFGPALLSFFLLLIISNPVNGQLSTMGKEFWVGFMENNRSLPSGNNQGNPDFAVIVISADENATGVIEHLGSSTSFSLVAGQQFTFRMPSLTQDLLHRTTGVIENKGIHITSTGKIAIHAFNERSLSADGTVILPVATLGKDYYITSHYEFQVNGSNNESTLLVVATEDNTQIEITTSVATLSGNVAKVPSFITLNRGQSYQIKARDDLTGSRIRVVGTNADDCKKISVFGGNKWTRVGNCGAANDHLFQQAYPVNTWGTSFVHVALEGRSSGELVKVVAAEAGTEIFVNGTSRGTLNQAEWMSIAFDEDESAKIVTSKPASVTVFSKSMECNRANSPEARSGDPFMITYSPVEQLLKRISFNAMALPAITVHYVNLVVKKGSESKTILDGQNVGGSFSPLSGDPNFSIARISISQGIHRLENSDGFTAYVYGFGEIESYGYAAGAALDNFNFIPEASYDFDITGEKVACLDVEALWGIKSENPNFTYFVWNFGDGTATKIGQQTLHTFTKPGIYEVVVVAAISPNSCEESEEITFEVEVLEPTFEIVGETSVCPEVEEVMYRLENMENVGTAKFEIFGGQIIQEFSDAVIVKWGAANPEAFLRVTPYTQTGCPGTPIDLMVVINQEIEVSEALGELDVCFDSTISHPYSVPNAISSRGYDWVVAGGKLISGQGGPEIEIIWDQPGVTGTVEYTAYSLLDTECEGKAPLISVKVAKEFDVALEKVLPLLCFGGNTGEIAIQINGGVAPFVYAWEHDSNLKTGEAKNLSAGKYSVKITDQLGCVKEILEIEIIQPSLLSLSNVKLEGVSCYGKPDGTVSLTIVGGITPYSIEYNGTNFFNASILLTDIPSGKYAWEVTDSNGCKTPVSFEITSPAPLEVEVRLEKPACPGGSNGELFAFPAGGVGPYVYSWENQSSFGSQLIGIPKGNYNVSVTDKIGCVSLGVGEVIEKSPVVRMPTGFNPKNEELYQGVSDCEIDFDLWIYNRWGQLIYSGGSGWDGLVGGVVVPTGNYSYLMRHTFALEGKVEAIDKRGTFTLIW
jgi:PKD repeat protein